LPGSGISTIVGPGGTQTVYFEELEPVLDWSRRVAEHHQRSRTGQPAG